MWHSNLGHIKLWDTEFECLHASFVYCNTTRHKTVDLYHILPTWRRGTFGSKTNLTAAIERVIQWSRHALKWRRLKINFPEQFLVTVSDGGLQTMIWQRGRVRCRPRRDIFADCMRQTVCDHECRFWRQHCAAGIACRVRFSRRSLRLRDF